jgi:hypothetical protein
MRRIRRSRGRSGAICDSRKDRKRRLPAEALSSNWRERAAAALEEVSGVIRKLEEQILQLRRENQRVAAIRRLVSR